MPRVHTTVPPDAIRIEDEVWQEAFTRREPGRSRSRRRLQTVDGGRTSSTLEPQAGGLDHPEPGLWAPDRTAERIEIPDWLETPAADSAPGRHVDLLGGTSSLDGDSSSAAPIAQAGLRPGVSPTGVSRPGLSPTGVSPTLSPTGPSPSGGGARRTVTIRSRGAESYLPWPDASRGRPQRAAYERTGFRPDRLAMWAVLLGFLLVLVAILSGH